MAPLTTLVLWAAAPSAQSPLTFTITPSSPADPIKSCNVQVSQVQGAPTGADWLLLETVSGPQFSGLLPLSAKPIPNGPGPAWIPLAIATSPETATVKWWSEYFDRNDEGHDPIDPTHASTGDPTGSVTLALSAWQGRNGTKLATAPTTAVMHYDKSYTALRWNLTAAPRGTPGTVRLQLVPADSESEALAADTGLAWWFRYKHTTTPAGQVAQFAEDPSIEQTLEPPTFDLTVSLGGRVYFVGIFGSFSTGICGGFPQGSKGFVSQRAPLADLGANRTGFQPLAIIIPFSNGTVPQLPAGFMGPRITLPNIPGDARLALQPFKDETYSKVSMFDGGTIAMSLLYPQDESTAGKCEGACITAGIEVELPVCITLQNWSKNFAYTVVPSPSSQPSLAAAPVGTYRVRLRTSTALHGFFYYDQRVFWLSPKISCPTPSTQTVKLRPLLTEAAAQLPDNWQELQVSVVATPTPLANPPKRLAPSLTWAPTFHFAPNETAEGMEHSIRMFNNVGMTTIPQDGCRNLQPSVNPQSYYTLEQRAQLDFWKGLKYGPQISSFYQSFNGIGMYQVLVMTPAALEAFNMSTYLQERGLTVAEIQTELGLLANALDFYQKVHYIDAAYDGFFFEDALNVTRQIVGYTKPDFWYVDSENFCPWQVWLANVGVSKNAASRRQEGEDDASLAYRISKEFMTRYNGTVNDASNGATTVGFFGASSKWEFFPWSIMQELGQLSQPGWYGQHNTRNLQQTVNQIASEKRAVGHGPGANRIIPWLSTGTGGPISPTSCFDELIHMFLNGASGFSYYADTDFSDMEYYLRISEAMRTLVPYEDLIVDGELAGDGVTAQVNCVVSAMGLAGEFLIGVTPLEPTKAVGFTFRGNATGQHTLIEAATGKLVTTVTGGEVAFKATLASTGVYRFAPSTVDDVAGN